MVHVPFPPANIALKHQTLDAESTGKDSPTTDGILKGGPCFLRTRNPYWWIKFGSTVRVAVVFVMHAEDSYSSSKGIKIKVGRKIEVGHGECVILLINENPEW